ncbi:MAG: hypothetical protein JWM68_1841 [Verrucomicrobiales bacterium]|nr:hypothetical protein [Verrucomicrobiales bacterium]
MSVGWRKESEETLRYLSRMKKCIIFVLLQVVLVSKGLDQPTNFMIGKFTFERPTAWKWIDPSLANEHARMLIMDEVLKEKAIVSFELVIANPVPSFPDKWAEPYLTQSPPPKIVLQTNTVNQCRVITVDISGTKVVNKEPSTNQATHGVIIYLKGEEIGARILGAKPMVDKLKPVFTQIIKEALKPEESP